MTENIERLLVNGSNEPNSDETSEFIKQRDHHTTEIAKLLNSVREETSFRSNLSTYQSIHRHLMFLKDLDFTVSCSCIVELRKAITLHRFFPKLEYFAYFLLYH